MPEKVPRLVASVDVRKFKLDPMDGFLLTRIDGRLGRKDLVRETGLPDFSVDRALEKLEKLGVVEWIDPNAPPPAASPPPAEANPPGAAPSRGGLPEFTSLSEPKYDPSELDEPADLTADQKKRILDLYYRLDDLDHYTLLGLPREADKKTVKRSYFELAAHLHPDRYFKKNLGSFKAKMEVLFGRITEAHDTLIDPDKRAEYDAYVAEIADARGMEAMLERALQEAKSAPASPQRISNPGPPPPSGPSPEEIRARKEALARRLLGGSMRPPQGSAPPARTSSQPARYSSPGDAMDALKRRYEERRENATVAQSRKYIDVADEALARNDVVAAASALGIATKFAPEDTALAMRFQELKNRADHILCDSYLKQAQYEERQGHWAEAARSWLKVAKVRAGEAHIHDRVALALMKSDGDLREAAEHAKQAVTLEASAVPYHVTLAEVYLKAGLTASAKRVAENALALDPKNLTLQAVVKRASK